MSIVHTLQSISQTTTQRRPAEQANPIRQRADQTNALGVAIAGTTAVNYVQNLAQQNRNNIDIVVEDLTEEAVDRVIAANPGVEINTPIAVDNGREWANETIDNLNGQNVAQPQEDINRARHAIVTTLPNAAAVSQDAETITSVSGGKKCNCTVQKTFCAVLALDFIVRKPGEEKKDDDPEAPADKQIVDMVNKSAACWGIDVSQPFTVEDVKPLLKEVQEWYHMSEKDFWATQRTLSDLIPQWTITYGIHDDFHKPEWTWVFPNDGALLSTVLATIYKDKGVDAMYDFIGQYKYYKKTLPRSVALDVVIAALTRLMPKKK